MAATVVQTKTGAFNTATASQSLSFDSPVTSGNTVILIVGSDDYRTSPATGFTRPTGGAQQTNLGHYFEYKVAGAGEQAYTVTTNSAVTWCWALVEVSGVGALEVSNGQNQTSSVQAYTTPAVTPGTGERFVIATLGASLGVATPPAITGIGTWTNSFVEIADVRTVPASGTADAIGVAIRAFTGNGATTVQAGGTFEGGTPQALTGIIAVFVEAAPASQVAAPASDITVTGWTTTGAASPFAALDEATASDTDYVSSAANPTGSVFEVGATALQDPNDDTGHTYWYRFRATGSSSSVIFGLYQGATLIASRTVTTNPSTFTTGSFTLTTGEAATITNYADLRFRVTATAA